MNSSIAYRLARTADWAAIRVLLQSCDLPLQGAADCLDSFLVAIIDTEIVGCAAIDRHSDAALFRSCADYSSLHCGTKV